MIQKIIHEFIRNRRGICLGEEYVGILAFADDIALTDTSIPRMQSNLTLLESMLNRFGMELNTEKTEYMTQMTGEL